MSRRTVAAVNVEEGNYLRWGSDPIYREVVETRRGPTGDVLITVIAGSLLEDIPPLLPTETVEVDTAP